MPVGPHLVPTSYTITDLDNVDHSLSTIDCEKEIGVWMTILIIYFKQYKVLLYYQTFILQEIHLTSFQEIHLTSFIKHTSSHICENCIQTCNPYYAMDIDMLEKIQHRHSGTVPQNYANLPYQNASRI